MNLSRTSSRNLCVSRSPSLSQSSLSRSLVRTELPKARPYSTRADIHKASSAYLCPTGRDDARAAYASANSFAISRSRRRLVKSRTLAHDSVSTATTRYPDGGTKDASDSTIQAQFRCHPTLALPAVLLKPGGTKASSALGSDSVASSADTGGVDEPLRSALSVTRAPFTRCGRCRAVG